MSIKSIERRLCSSFYDMAWLNLSAGIENLPEEAGQGGLRALKERERQTFLTAAKTLVEALADGDADTAGTLTEQLLAQRSVVAETVERLSRYRAEGRLLRNALLRKEAAAQDTIPVKVEDEVRELLGKMFSSEDPMITNLRIRSMVAAFPARLTKTRFYDRIAGYLSLYNGQEDSEGLNAFRYRLYSAAALRDGASGTALNEDEWNGSAAFAESLLTPARQAVASGDGEVDDAILEGLQTLNTEIDAAVSELEGIARCINAAAAIGLLTGMNPEISADSSVAGVLLPAVKQQLIRAVGEPVDEAEYERAAELAHGAMETYFEPLSVLMETETGRLQAEIDKMDDETAEAYIPVMKAARLMSTSAFASLEHVPAVAVTPERVEECRDALIRNLDMRMEGQPKALVREIMGNVLAELPVWFENRTEVMEYMLQSLQGCRTEGERRFAVRLLRAAL